MKKLEYYHHLRTLGIDEDHARRMTKQATERDGSCPDRHTAVYRFAPWSDTEEGHDYWYSYAGVTK